MRLWSVCGFSPEISHHDLCFWDAEILRALLTYLKISLWVSDGRSMMVFAAEAAADASIGEMVGDAAMVVVAPVVLVFPLSASRPITSSVRLNTYSCWRFVMGVAPFRLLVLGRFGIIERLGRRRPEPRARSPNLLGVGSGVVGKGV